MKVIHTVSMEGFPTPTLLIIRVIPDFRIATLQILHLHSCSTYPVRIDLKAGYMHPRIDEAIVNRITRIACSTSRKGATSMLGIIHLSMVEATWVPAVPRATPIVEPRRAAVAM